ncbi:hypothetical protein SK066_09240 [Paenibacillus hunanensis]|uniref:hypothetical protein n=1 Tax=Paenibacillus hunanensis TaxID=539262 RepID=UPI002A6A9887|nr:hypothetical protein [Paenibacillus hunanensis]WPP43100.1 hypothetical protein SK066_09240 [Paenibacillus hunanensis]
MSERLSRLERYGTHRDEGLLTSGRIKVPGGRSNRSSRTVRKASYQPLQPNGEAAEHELGEEEEEEDKEYAPRSTIYPSRKIKLAKFFYGYLIFMFVVLTGMLLWWGFKLSGFTLTWSWFKQLMM